MQTCEGIGMLHMVYCGSLQMSPMNFEKCLRPSVRSAKSQAYSDPRSIHFAVAYAAAMYAKSASVPADTTNLLKPLKHNSKTKAAASHCYRITILQWGIQNCGGLQATTPLLTTT